MKEREKYVQLLNDSRGTVNTLKKTLEEAITSNKDKDENIEYLKTIREHQEGNIEQMEREINRCKEQLGDKRKALDERLRASRGGSRAADADASSTNSEKQEEKFVLRRAQDVFGDKARDLARKAGARDERHKLTVARKVAVLSVVVKTGMMKADKIVPKPNDATSDTVVVSLSKGVWIIKERIKGELKTKDVLYRPLASWQPTTGPRENVPTSVSRPKYPLEIAIDSQLSENESNDPDASPKDSEASPVSQTVEKSSLKTPSKTNISTFGKEAQSQINPEKTPKSATGRKDNLYPDIIVIDDGGKEDKPNNAKLMARLKKVKKENLELRKYISKLQSGSRNNSVEIIQRSISPMFSASGHVKCII